jgi:hypothetical protein
MSDEQIAVTRLGDGSGFTTMDGPVMITVKNVKQVRGAITCWITARTDDTSVVDTLNLSTVPARAQFRAHAQAQGIIVREVVLLALLRAAGEVQAERDGKPKSVRSGGSSSPPRAAATPVRRLADRITEIRRPVIRGPDGSTFVRTWLAVAVTDPDTGDTIIRTEPLVLSRDRSGTVAVHGPAADLIGTPTDLPTGVILAPIGPPVASRAGVLLTAATARELLNGARPNLVSLLADLCTTFHTFVTFAPTGKETPADCAVFYACYAISTYLLDAFTAVGYLWVKGLPNSGKSTVVAIIGRVGYLPLFTSANTTLPALRSHAEAGGVAIIDNITLAGRATKDESLRALISFAEFGYQRDARVPLQVPKARGKGWETVSIPVFAPRAFTSVDDPPDALGSRCMEHLMLRTGDREKAARAPMDDDDWPVAPDAIIQECWMVALHHLQDAAATVRTITSAATTLTNRDLQIYRPVLTVARLIDKANGDTAVWDAVMRVARALLDRRAEDDGSRETFIVRALLALAAEGKEKASASIVMEKANTLAEEQDADTWGLDNSRRVGRLLTRLGVPKTPRGEARGYLLDLATLERLRATFLPLPPSEKNDGNDGNDGNVVTSPVVSDVFDITDVLSGRSRETKNGAKTTVTVGDGAASVPAHEAGAVHLSRGPPAVP